MYIPIEQRPAAPSLQASQATTDAPITALAAEQTSPMLKTTVEQPQITEELLIEEVSIDGMCGVY